MAGDETLLFGTISLDHYLGTADVLPGGGILNMAWHWRELGRAFRVVTRIGEEDGAPILEFLDRHSIRVVGDGIVAPGRSAAIDIAIQADRQPDMQNFRAGIWDDFQTTPPERDAVAAARRIHVVLVEGAIAELARLAGDRLLAAPTVSADFLGFRHYTVDRLARTMGHVDVGFIGWPGDEDDPAVQAMRDVAFDLGRLLIVTMGSRAIHVFDGRRTGGGPVARRIPVTPVPVAGTTLGCGDAFIAWFLDELWRDDVGAGADDASDAVVRAVERGKMGGALATAWERPLPDEAYSTAVRPARAAQPLTARP
jgi:sugar/nucleoside kinase (ribokinase family)